MRRIIKGSEPVEFANKKSRYIEWTDLKKATKQVLRESLCKDQYYLCCYCGKKINPCLCDGPNGENNVVIEHIFPRASNKPKMFDYNNLLASCNGNKYLSYRGSGYEKEDWYTCDDAKGNELITVTPLDANCEGRTLVSRRGKLIIKNSTDIDFNDTIEKLCLNAKVLRFEREKVIRVYFKDAESLKDKTYIQKIIDKMDQINASGELPTFSYQVKRFAQNLIS